MPTLHFIWKSHSFQFLVDALPIGFWHVLMNPKNCQLGSKFWSPRKLLSIAKKVQLFLKIGCVYFVSLFKTRYHGNFWKILFVGTVHNFSTKKKVSVVPTQELYFHFIRTCHHPIREGIDQKLKYRQNPCKMKDWKKMS